jgi:addiction module HigA family antidote
MTDDDDSDRVTGPMLDPSHPGDLVRHECLEPLSLTVTKAATQLGVSRKTLDNLVNRRAGVSPEMAVRLAAAFGGSAQAWINMQAAYDYAQVRKREDEIRATVRSMKAEGTSRPEPA